ncbi:AraC-type transcriptional regulator [Sinobacterium caligoides]|uniref:AraC-type transcriptional regulator n=1 Tax=Sinobacterium caligoides TaxID=933926 RepID=A0A3N2D538_9GAMM|nr:AraC family transcriptional regulator [Sinobacterium caligoides]ROR94925.1 AraC-type transcriptional regulator [Sinobacterium caligoides]
MASSYKTPPFIGPIATNAFSSRGLSGSGVSAETTQYKQTSVDVSRALDQDSCYIHSHYVLTELLDLFAARGIDSHKLLRGSKLFYDDIVYSEKMISAEQYRVILKNAIRLKPGENIALLYGERLLQNPLNPLCRLLDTADSFTEALASLMAYQRMLLPLCQLRQYQTGPTLLVYLLDFFHDKPLQRFTMETLLGIIFTLIRRHPTTAPTELKGFCDYLADKNGLAANYSEDLQRSNTPKYIATQFFHSPITNGIALSGGSVVAPEQTATNDSAQMISTIECRRHSQSASGRPHMIDLLYQQVLSSGKHNSLNQSAEAFGMSPATLKRRLKSQGYSFQQLLDLCRFHRVMYLLHHDQLNTQQLAEALGFHDARSFRRAFKRSTGALPRDFVQHWLI